jgi:hypothetical protein
VNQASNKYVYVFTVVVINSAECNPHIGDLERLTQPAITTEIFSMWDPAYGTFG